MLSLSGEYTLLSFPNSHCSLNPVVKLFTGHCRTEGLLEGQKFVNESDFGAFPIQVQGHAHLHDSLEAACVNSEMGQEVRGIEGETKEVGEGDHNTCNTAGWKYSYIHVHVHVYT